MPLFPNLLVSAISSPVGDGKRSNPLDVISVRKNLAHLGLDTGDFRHGLIDRKLDTAIRKFQTRKKLKVDGLIYPGGETERVMNVSLRQISEEEGDDSGEEDNNEGNEDNEDGEDNGMPALPPGGVEREPLPPPNIPGTNIPDKGIPEGMEPDQDYLDDRDKWRYEIDPRFEIPRHNDNPEWEA